MVMELAVIRVKYVISMRSLLGYAAADLQQTWSLANALLDISESARLAHRAPSDRIHLKLASSSLFLLFPPHKLCLSMSDASKANHHRFITPIKARHTHVRSH